MIDQCTIPEKKWSTTQAQGMGPYYHHLHGLQLKSLLLNCTEEEARRICACLNACEGLTTDFLEANLLSDRLASAG
ncbi:MULTISPECIES: hypothetical protein [Comamonas]|uniref:hypothetical protein n=1 Tax=Comamonas TaxID=283 RepID=UPI0015F8951F|nr:MULTISPECIES: hypothetical protein [Comamonas]UUC96601.1 hypothetical protein NOX35_27205 [Comamonas sp. C11]